MRLLLIALVLGGCAAQAKNTCVAKCTECKGAELLCDFERGGTANQPVPK